jgi:hypothetical protein
MTQDEINNMQGLEVTIIDITNLIGKELAIISKEGWANPNKKNHFHALVWKQTDEPPQSKGTGKYWTGKWKCEYINYFGTREYLQDFESKKKLVEFLKEEALKYFNLMRENDNEQL